MPTPLAKILRSFTDGEYYGLLWREDRLRLDAWLDEDFGWDPVLTVALTAAFGRGIGWSGAAYTAVASQNVVLVDGATNYVQRTPAGVISANQAGFTVTTHIPVCTLTTVGGAITAYVDYRAGVRALVLSLAPLASPALTGVPTAPTAAPGTNTTQIATTAFTVAEVAAAIATLIGTAPGVLDTLGEISDAINDDANLYTTLVAALALKADLASPTFTGTPTVPDEAYGAGWNGSLGIPTKNAVYDKIETVVAGAPAAHAASHQSGGGDAIKLDDLAAADDNTDLNVSSAKHGLAPKSPADAEKFLNGAATPAYTTPLESIIIAVGDETTAITTGTAKVTFRMPYAFTLVGLPRASLTTASSANAPAIDINEAGVSIFSTTLTIDANEKTSTTAVTPAVVSDTALADDAEITIDIDAAGTGAKGLKVTLIGRRA